MKTIAITDDILGAARIIWEYHQLRHEPIPADIIVALGTNDLRVAEFAAELYLRGIAPLLVCSGAKAHGEDLLATRWTRSEAEMYADVAQQRGVPRERILLETCATNTAENIRFTRRMLAERGLRPNRVLIAVKPFMQRRTWATMAVEWPEMAASITSPEMTLDEYFTEELTPEKIINIMVGDLQRLWVYAHR
ncbi:MAG TPA: YdcF family protein, partial [Bryobacteraceae bacterium]|nr:YdcF family protein [Bryobacteraceae bacterium]